jgi:hypothetical protein
MSRRGGGSSKTEGYSMITMGLLLLAMWGIVASFTLLTNQAWILTSFDSAHSIDVRPSLTVFTQPWDLIMGNFHGKEAIAVIISWGLLLVYVTVSAMEWFIPDNIGDTADKWYKAACYVIILIDSCANWQYLQIIEHWVYQIIGTTLMFAILIWCGKTGFMQILNGLSSLKEE